MFKHTVIMDTYSERIKQNPSMADRRITAEQILHLCRLLTDQSKNKSFDNKCQYMGDDSSKEIQSEDISSSRQSEQDYCDRVDDCDSQQQEKSLEDSNLRCHHTVGTIKTKQAKKDILNKIRNQIFERKRQKLAHMQRTVGGVWRPW